jgi:hypothetical protein
MQTDDTLQQLIRRELPGLLRQDPEFRTYVREISQQVCADKAETEDRFTILLNELRRDREASNRKWDECMARMDREHAEQKLKWDEHNRHIDAFQKEQAEKWDQQNRKWEEQNRKWDENQKEIRELTKKLDRSIGALGARWGMQSEASFRNALAGILEGNFAVQVINYTDYDDSGEVFGRPEQVELDIIIQNGKLLICELKSSIDRGGMYLFERKARFYEKKHQCKADKLIVISPMISSKAENVAKQLGIMTYSDSDDVKSL